MNFLLIDDDEAVRLMLQDIIEDYSLGTVVSSLASAADLTAELLAAHHIDILIIDMLMPDIDGIQAIAKLHGQFRGKIIMLSQIESKDLVGKAYAEGVDYYITKPLNRNEIVGVIRNVSEHLRLAAFARNLQSSLAGLSPTSPAAVPPSVTAPAAAPRKDGLTAAKSVMRELGLLSALGTSDILDIVSYLQATCPAGSAMPSLKSIFLAIASQRNAADPRREAKAMEQRLRRTVFQGLVNLATMGAVDYTNPLFEEYAPLYFDYADVRHAMTQIENNQKPTISDVHINLKKFISALYDATQK